MSTVSHLIVMPSGGGAYIARLNHWLPRLLGSDDTVLGETAYFRLRWFADGSLASPSPGHLAHAGTHVQQYRAMRAALPSVLRWAALVWWPVHWLFYRSALEAAARDAAETYRDDPRLVQQYQALRAAIHLTPTATTHHQEDPRD